MTRNSTSRMAAGAIMPNPAQVSRPLMERKRRGRRAERSWSAWRPSG